jgi:hypothetical protein
MKNLYRELNKPNCPGVYNHCATGLVWRVYRDPYFRLVHIPGFHVLVLSPIIVGIKDERPN